MKKVLSFLLAAIIVFALSACSTVDLNTPKSEELAEKYDYYSDSMNVIRSEMHISPEQADEVFIVLSSVGLDEKITYIFKNADSTYKVWWGLTSVDVTIEDGVVSQIKNGSKSLYPESEANIADENEPTGSELSKDESSEMDTETVKSVALALDSQIYENVLNSEKTTQLLQEGIALVSDGSGNMLELYDLAKAAKETQTTLFSNLLSLSDNNTKSYVEVCQLYVGSGKTVAEKLMKYIDKQEMKYLSDAKEALESSETYTLKLILERTNYLSSQGLTDEEISAILAPESAE